MAHPSVVGPLGEADLADELRPRPVDRRARFRAAVERALVGLDLAQLRDDARERLLVETRPDVPDVLEFARFVEAEDERAEVLPRPLRLGPPGDDRLLALLRLDLEPVGRPPFDVRAAAALRDDPFEAFLPRGFEERGAV